MVIIDCLLNTIKLNKMKILFKTIVIAFAFIVSTADTFGQKSLHGHSGLYLNAQDFNNKKLSYEIDCSVESHKISTDKIFNKSKLDIIHAGKKYSYDKKDLFGFRDCNNRDFRFIDNKEYRILDTEGFCLLSSVVYIRSGKTDIKKPAYYFSKESDGTVQELTLENLKAAFPGNHKFHDMLDAQFKGDDNLGVYDSFHKTYKVNHIYSQSLK